MDLTNQICENENNDDKVYGHQKPILAEISNS